MQGNPVGWFEIYVDDMARAKAFYQAMLALELEHLRSEGIEMWSFPMTPDGYGSSGALARVEGMAAGGNSTLVYFEVEDCAVEAARIEGAGGKLVRDKMSIGEHGFVALAHDTEGNMFGLHSAR